MVDPDENKLQQSLGPRELFYQFVHTKFGTIYCLATCNSSLTGWIQTQIEDLSKILKYLASKIQAFDSSTEDEIEPGFNSISGQFYQPLFAELARNKYETIWICQDMALPLFSTSLIRNGNRWLIEDVPCVKNVLSAYQLVKALTDEREHSITQEHKSSPRLYTFGNDQDKAINRARNWVIQKAQGRVLHYDNPSEAELEELSQCGGTSLSIIVGHGLSDHDASKISGANAIEGKGKSIQIAELAPIVEQSNCVAFITCRSGTPFENQLEGGSGLWVAIMSQNVKGAIVCRWDVMIEPSLIILEEILAGIAGGNIALALCESKRKLINTQKWHHPYYWSGLEYWGGI